MTKSANFEIFGAHSGAVVFDFELPKTCIDNQDPNMSGPRIYRIV
jgi:hypothetical protein